MPALVVAGSKAEALTALTEKAGLSVTLSDSAADAARLVSEKDFDSVIISAPLAEGSAAQLAEYVSHTSSAAVLLLAPEGAVSGKRARELQETGVFVLETPLKKEVFLAVLRAATAGAGRFRREKAALGFKLEEARAVSRAKALLMSQLNMSEAEAHRFIEREAMNGRVTKAEIAARILRIYQN